MRRPIIEFSGLERTYPGKVPTRALRGVSYSLVPGAFLAVMGRSGSGKSTLLRQLGLLDRPSSGTITIDGVDVGALSERDRTAFRLERLGYIFQEYALVMELSALENVMLPALALGKNRAEALEKGEGLLSMVGLSDRLHHYPNELSGGEQQRVAIARSLVNSPKVLFADEPCANLDTVSAKTVLELFKRLQKELGQTIVMVTHEPDDRAYVDEEIFLIDGRIVENSETI